MRVMRRFLLSVLVIMLGFFMVAVSALSVGKRDGFANEETVIESVGGEASGAAVMMEEKQDDNNGVNYYLPYPGLLPDHPLYFFKMVRDQVKLLLTRDKAERQKLYLLYADKRVGAARVLVEGSKSELGAETAVKAEGYLTRAVEGLGDVNERDTLDATKRAVEKHKEVLEGLLKAVSGEAGNQLEKAYEMNKNLVDKLGLVGVGSEEQEEKVETSVDEVVPVEIQM